MIHIVLAVVSSVDVTSFFNKLVGYDLPYLLDSGYIDLDWHFNSSQKASIYYMLQQKYGSDLKDPEVPVIFWLQGGPGAPSQFGCYNQVGAINIMGNNESNFKGREHWFSWNNLGHVVCVDQPLNVGFSYGDVNVTDSFQASSHFSNFIYKFLREKNLLANPVYLTGESYAGHYILAFAHDIMMNSTRMNVNLQGLAIGDGWVDPALQTSYYGQYLHNVGVQDNLWRDHSNWWQSQAILNLLNFNMSRGADCINQIINNQKLFKSVYNNMSIYNFRITDYEDQEGILNPFYDKFLNLSSTKEALHIPKNVNYVSDNQTIYNMFSKDLATSFTYLLQRILDRGMRVLIYNGQNDFIVNTAGVLNYLDSVRWRGAAGWKRTPKKHFRQFGDLLGWYKMYDNLNFVLINNAGHLLPTDQPLAAFSMLRNFIYHGFS